MARNEVFKDADYLSLPVAEGTLSGDPVRVGELNGIAQTDRAVEGDFLNTNIPGYASVALRGAFLVPIDGVETLAIGAQVFWNATNDGLAAAGTIPFGVALTPKTAVDGETVVVRIAN